jgi:hypothetical protein
VTSVSAVNPLRVAISATLKTIPRLYDAEIGGHVYHEGEVRQGDPVPRVVMGSTPESRAPSRYNQDVRFSGALFIKCWDLDSWSAQELYELVVGRLHGVPLTVNAHRLVSGQVERVTDFPEPDPKVAAHVVVARYATIAQADL